MPQRRPTRGSVDVRMKILVVDDRSEQLSETTEVLTSLGHSVTSCQDSDDAWVMLNEEPFEAVLTNWDLQQPGGLALCRRIRQGEFERYIYVILLIELGDQPSLVEGIAAGADDFLSKSPGRYQLAVQLRTAQRFLIMEHRLSRKHRDLEAIHNTIRKDLESAARTQLALLPKPIYTGPLKAWWSYRPAIFVGGDTFNFFSPAEDIWIFYSIDVSGHGLSAAMLSIHLQAHIKTWSQSLYGADISAEQLPGISANFARNLNAHVADSDSDHYLTMIFGIIDLTSDVVHYVQAGHPHPWVYSYGNNSLQPVCSNGFPIGLLSDADWTTEQLRFEPGDRLIVYSDGLLENAELEPVPGRRGLRRSGEPAVLTMAQQKTMFSYLCSSANDEDLDLKVRRCIGDKSKSSMTDDINVLVFEYQRSA